MKRMFLILAVLICFVVLPASAARKDKPTGKEVGDKAKAAKLDNANAATGEKGGKKVKFTPAVLGRFKSASEVEDGQVVGVLETEASGDETGLPPGKYNLFLAKVGTDWHVYAESGGNIVAESARVKVEQVKEEPKSRKPEFRAQGWCISVFLCWPSGQFWPPFYCAWFTHCW